MEQHFSIHGLTLTNTHLPFIPAQDMELLDLLLRRLDKMEEELKDIHHHLDQQEGSRATWGKVWAVVVVVAACVTWVWEQLRSFFMTSG